MGDWAGDAEFSKFLQTEENKQMPLFDDIGNLEEDSKKRQNRFQFLFNIFMVKKDLLFQITGASLQALWYFMSTLFSRAECLPLPSYRLK